MCRVVPCKSASTPDLLSGNFARMSGFPATQLNEGEYERAPAQLRQEQGHVLHWQIPTTYTDDAAIDIIHVRQRLDVVGWELALRRDVTHGCRNERIS